MRNSTKFAIFIIILLVPICSLYNSSKSGNPFHKKYYPSYSQNENIHPKIRLIGNFQLEIFPNKTGSGTQADPYIIRDLNIDANENGCAVELTFVNKFVILENLTLLNSENGYSYFGEYPSGYAGIRTFNCSNIMIRNCIISDCYYGIRLTSSNKCEISGCEISNSEVYSISVDWDSYLILVHNNVIHELDSNAIEISLSSSIKCYDNTANTRGGATFSSYDAHNIELTDNSFCSTSGWNIEIYDCSYYTIKGNVLVSINSEYGIWAFFSSENCINNNLIENSENAIYFLECDNNKIKRNKLKNSNIGVILDRSNNNIVRLNRFLNTQLEVQELSSINNEIQLPTQIILIIWLVSGVMGLGMGSIVTIYLVKRSKKYKIRRLLNRGEKLEGINNLDDAIKHFDQILELDPKNELAMNKKIAILYEMKRYNEISEMLRNSSNNKQDN